MKYEISQGQWVDFFNMLTDQQKATRDITGGIFNDTGKGTDLITNRNTVAWTSGDATCTTSNHACNFLSWADGAAYADWAGLRPMTELEFEKACRGPLNGVANGYAWGNTTLTAITNFFGTDGSGTETGMPLTANCCYNNKVQGPVRCGLFATASSTRTASGATYWGIMEMSGNVWERPVTVADTGRSFTGTVGDGTLDATTGNANADLWPGTSASGAGFRGGEWYDGNTLLRTSDRYWAAKAIINRDHKFGGRSVRQAPSGLQ
jgi:formylglycine-generating enzyme required for sulfatase activity